MLWYLIIFVIIIYASLYFIFEDEITIYQTDLEHFDFNLLYKRQPLIINDNIKDIVQIIKYWFNTNIIHNDITLNNLWMRNSYKYLMIQSYDPIEITLCNPKTKVQYNIPELSTSMTTIKLKNNKILFIPFKWYYHINGNANIYGINDYITYFLGKMF